MGKKCAICGREAGAMDRKKLDNGEVICSWCVEAISFSEGFNKTRFKQSSVDELKERIEFVKKRKARNQERISKFKMTYDTGYIWFDDENQWFALTRGLIKKKIDNSYVFDYNEIIGYELIDDSGSVMKGGLGKAIVGGALLGPVGAIAGGTSKKISQVCTRLELVITTKNVDYPTVKIYYLSGETSKTSITYINCIDNAQKIISKVNMILNQMQEVNSRNDLPVQLSPADEIKKYKELLDIGAITLDEFESKKKQLLNL